ncbi:phosphopantetheine adenylyltransferase [Aquabacterium humicola]|uniref:phosphopantetheine adenylyltransferase n=1 Tax=Aquabacterium humicola TaxID=3237377 RepID=UPI002543AE6C|nr:phosphopantetheine adenylyltransferase [Rubrivivax pictus]
MRYVIPLILVLVALVHLLPLAGVLGASQLQDLYGIPVAESNLEILMRHRAVLFGLLAAGLLWAAFRPDLRTAALAAGVVSVGSFVWLAWSVGGANAALQRVAWVDVLALALLVIGAVLHAVHEG